MNVAKNHTYSSFLSVLALSSVIGRQIQSYYPLQCDTSPDIYETMFNCTVIPRISEILEETPSKHDSSIYIFRCASMPIDYILTTGLSSTKDHLVSLMPTDTKDTMFAPPVAFVERLESKIVGDFTETTSARNLPTTTLPVPAKQPSKRKQLLIGNFAAKVPKAVTAPPSSSTSLKATPSSTATLSTIDDCSKGKCIPSTSSQPSTLKRDVGHLLSCVKTLNDEEKYHLLVNPDNFRPSSNFCYPVSSRNRRFLHKWFQTFPWLGNSESLDGAFCLTCILFAAEENTHNATKLDQLYTSPFQCWTNAQRIFRNHMEKSPLHHTASLRASFFRQSIENKTKFIDIQMNKIVDKQVERNGEKLAPIVDAVTLCGRQNLALRGRRDDAQHYDDSKSNLGNLQEILKFLECYRKNSVFDKHLLNSPTSSTYRSKTTQNEILTIREEMIKEKLSSEVKKAKYFSVLADEAADVSNVEQMPLVIRYVNSDFEICEAFTGFIACDESVSGEAISEKVLQRVEDLSLNIIFCRGQGYDGAKNMAGKCSGAARRIADKYPKAPYVHCGSHALNLSVASACNIQVVRNMMGHVKAV